MKTVVLVTYTDCENKWRSLEAAGHDVHVIQYDDKPHDRHSELMEQVQYIAPDFTVFIGAVERYHNRPVPKPDVLCKIREVAPLIHMCNDAADPPWWEWLQIYHDRECFDVQVNIDGARETPIASFIEGLTLLTPIDTRVFAPQPWHEREMLPCLVGGLCFGVRRQAITQLMNRGMLRFYQGPVGRSYDDMAAILCRSRFVFNCPLTGSGERTHVKGRVVECGFAGATLIEFGESPTQDWFSAEEYFVANTIDQVEELVKSNAGENQASLFHEKIKRDHHPRIFWRKVLSKAGIDEEREAEAV